MFNWSLAILFAQASLVAPLPVEAIGPKQDDPRCASQSGIETPALGRGIVVQGGLEAIGPKQDDPRQVAGLPGSDDDPKASGIVTQGGLEAIGPKQDDPRAAGRLLAIGPKQDDPRAPAVRARPGDDDDPHAQGCEVMQR